MAKFAKLIVFCAIVSLALPGLFAQEKPAGTSGNAAKASATAEKEETDETKLLLDPGAEPGTDAVNQNAARGAVRSGDRISTFTFWDFVRMILILAAVVAAIYLIFRILKKKSSPRLQDADLFKVLSTQVIANNRSLHLVEVGRQIFLVGAAENAVNLISEIADKETLDEIRLKSAQYKETERMTFVEKLSGIFKPLSGGRNVGGGTGAGGPGSAGISAPPTEFFKKQRERLKRF